MAEFLHDIEAASRDELEALQLKRMKKTLHHAYENVGHYKAAFKGAGVHPDDLASLDDLSKFPFTTKNDLRRAYPFGMFAVPRERIRRIHASSGTTGKPTVVGYTDRDIETWADLVARSIHASGGRPGDMVHVSYGYGLFTGGLGAHYGAEKLGCTVVPASGGATARQVQMIHDFKPRIIMVTPSYMLALADQFERDGLDHSKTSLEIGIHGAEPWTEEMRREIEMRFGIDAIDIYGLSEVIGPGVANEYKDVKKDGLHVFEDHFYPEIIDPDTGKALDEGEQGELVFTSLTKEAMPVIRYRTGDLTVMKKGTVNAFRRIRRITGRTDDMLIIRGVNIFPSQIEEILMGQEVISGHYQLVVGQRGRMKSLTVRTETAKAMDADHRAALAEKVHAIIRSRLGVNCRVLVEAPGTLPRSEGKAQRVILGT